MTSSECIFRSAGATLAGVLLIVLLVSAPAPVYAQGVGNVTEQPTIDSPLLPTASPSTPWPTATPSAMSTATPTDTPSPTPTATATPDLAAAALQVSPLHIAADDRPIGASSALLWIALSALIVVIGAGVMIAARQRDNRY